MTTLFSDEVDLLNVSFDGPSAPDRISARMGVNELRRITPSRRYHLSSLKQLFFSPRFGQQILSYALGLVVLIPFLLTETVAFLTQ